MGYVMWRTRTKNGSWNERRFHKFYWPCLALLISCVIGFTAPGNAVRMALIVQNGRGGDLGNVVESAFHVMQMHLLHRGPWLVLAVVTGYIIGDTYGIKMARLNGRSLLLRLCALSVILIITCFVAIFPAALAVAGAPERAWVPISVLFVAAFFLSGFFLSITDSVRTRLAPLAGVLIPFCLLGGMGLTVFYLVRQAPVVTRYATVWDAHYQFMRSKQDSCGASELVFGALPPAGWLPSGGPTPDPKHWINGCMKGALELKCDIRWRPETPPR